MIEIVKELNIEVSKPNIFQAVVAKQYDMNTRFIKATFVDGADKILINPSATLTVVINAERPDGTSKGFDGVVNSDGTVTVPLHSWMLELVGTVICDISVINTATDDNKKLTTTSFTLLVEKAAYGGDDLTSDPQHDILVELIERVEAVAEAIDKPYELIEKITIATDGITTISRSQEPDGTPYNFKHLLIKNNIKISDKWDGAYVSLWEGYNKPSICYIENFISGSSSRVSVVKLDSENGLIFAQSTSGAWASQTYTPAVSVNSFGRVAGNIKDFEIATNAGTIIPIGSTIEVWGVRA